MAKTLKKQQARLERRRKAFDSLSGRHARRRPGSMNRHKSHPVGRRS